MARKKAQSFGDQWLKRALVEALGEPLTEEKLLGLERLEWSEYRAENGDAFGSIENLSGIERCTSIKVLELDGNAVRDLSPIAGLSSLEELWLVDNPVSDLAPLRELPKLKVLIIEKCSAVSDLSPLRGLTGLEHLNCSGTSIRDLSALVELKNLRKLSLSGLDLDLSSGSKEREIAIDLLVRGVDIAIDGLSELQGEARSRVSDTASKGKPVSVEERLKGAGALRLLGMLRADGLEARDGEDHSILHLLVRPPWDEENPVVGQERLDLVQALVDEGLDVDVCDSCGVTPLNYMLDAGEPLDVGLARRLLELGADPNRVPEYSPPAFALAAKSAMSELDGAKEVVELLIEHGVDLATPGNFVSLCDAGNADLVRRALEVGADVNAPDDRLYKPPLLVAARQGGLEIVEVLLQRGAEPSSRGQDGATALHEASTPEVTGLLLEHGADADAQTEFGQTPLFSKAAVGNLESAKLLLEKGASPTHRDGSGNTPLHNCQFHSWAPESLEIPRLLVEHGADVNALNEQEATPLDRANSPDLAMVLQRLGGLTASAMKSKD